MSDGPERPLRLFAAVVPPEAVVGDLDRIVAPLRRRADRLRWTAREQWHLTLLFLGRVDPGLEADLVASLRAAVGAAPPVTLHLAGGGAFPRPQHARVLWAGLDGEVAALARVAASCAQAARGLGLDAPEGPWRGHLTLARVAPPRPVLTEVAALEGYRGPAWTSYEVVLFRSHLGAGPGRTARHEAVQRFPLAG